MILKPIATAQSLEFYIRPMISVSNGYRIELRDDSANTTQTVTPTLTASTDYTRTFSAAFTNLNEATFYDIFLWEYKTENVKRLYFGKVYVTAQTDLADYTLNSGKYNEYDKGAAKREYIVY